MGDALIDFFVPRLRGKIRPGCIKEDVNVEDWKCHVDVSLQRQSVDAAAAEGLAGLERWRWVVCQGMG